MYVLLALRIFHTTCNSHTSTMAMDRVCDVLHTKLHHHHHQQLTVSPFDLFHFVKAKTIRLSIVIKSCWFLYALLAALSATTNDIIISFLSGDLFFFRFFDSIIFFSAQHLARMPCGIVPILNVSIYKANFIISKEKFNWSKRCTPFHLLCQLNTTPPCCSAGMWRVQYRRGTAVRKY